MLKILPQVKLFKKKKLKNELFKPYIENFTDFLKLSCIYTIKK